MLVVRKNSPETGEQTQATWNVCTPAVDETSFSVRRTWADSLPAGSAMSLIRPTSTVYLDGTNNSDCASNGMSAVRLPGTDDAPGTFHCPNLSVSYGTDSQCGATIACEVFNFGNMYPRVYCSYY